MVVRLPLSAREPRGVLDTILPARIRAAIPYVIVVLVTIMSLDFTYGLQGANLSYPIQAFGGDANIAVYIAKALGENAFPHNNRVGAPFGLDYNDCYQPDVIHHWILKLLMKITGKALLTVNIYYLFGFVLISCSAFYVLRRFRLSTMVAVLCAVLYAFIPSHLWRSYYHLFLSEYYLVPLVVLLAVRIMTDYPDERKSVDRAATEPCDSRQKQITRLLYFAVPLGALVGAGGVYYAFYSILVLGAAAFYALFRGRKKHSVIGFTCAAIISATTVLSMWPTLHYKAEHGTNEQVSHRTVLDTEVFGLEITDLYLPTPQHPIKKLRDLTNKYGESLPVLNENESQFASLGVIGAIGFTAMLLWPFVRHSNTGYNSVIMSLAVLALVSVLYATTGGFGTLFSLLITPEIRANNRMVFFIAFFSFFAFGFMLEKSAYALMRRSSARFLLGGLSVLLLIFGLYDQGTTTVRADVLRSRGAYRTAYEDDNRFIQRIESESPPGGNILQLPYVSFPEVPPVYHMGNYDHLQAYIYSKKLRWSFPAMRGRPGDDWIRDLSSAPIPELVRRAVLSGFCGIYIDRQGYTDSAAGLESQLRAVTGVEPIVSADGKLSFFSLTRYATALKQKTPPEQWSKMISEARPRFMITFLSGVYGLETDATHAWRWCDQKGTFEIFNVTGKEQRIKFTGELISAFPLRSSVFFHASKQALQATATSTGNWFIWSMNLKPGENRIDFETNAARVPAPGDARTMYFQMQHLNVLGQ